MKEWMAEGQEKWKLN